MQECGNAGMQECGNAGMQECWLAGITGKVNISDILKNVM